MIGKGCHANTADGSRICFKFNLSGCAFGSTNLTPAKRKRFALEFWCGYAGLTQAFWKLDSTQLGSIVQEIATPRWYRSSKGT